MTLKAVVFDYKALFLSDAQITAQVKSLLDSLNYHGISTCYFSTDHLDYRKSEDDRGFPRAAVYVDQHDVGVNRGSPAWIQVAEARLGVLRHEILYVGTTNRDWRSAINAGVFYFHAGWYGRQPGGTTCLVATTPDDVWVMASQFLIPEPRWSYKLDDPGRDFSLRCLLPASARLPSTKPTGQFRLQDVLTYARPVEVGSSRARDLLVLHAVSSLYSEGLLAQNSYFSVYPSSKAGRTSEVLEQYVKPAASLVHGYYKSDLLVRVHDAIDTSLERVHARSAGRAPNISLSTQAASVTINPKYEGKLSARTITVFDDFTTTGMSLEWARNLLQSAGAGHVVLVTIGKYSNSYTTHDLNAARDPFAASPIGPSDFDTTQQQLVGDASNEAVLRELFEKAIQGVP